MSIVDTFNFFKKNKLEILLISFFPIFLILGNFFINLYYIALTLISIQNINKNKQFFTSSIFYLLIFFLICLFLNIVFSSNINNSFPRLLKFILIVFVIIELQKFDFTNVYSFKKIIKFWIVTYLIVTADIIFELIFGFNTFGYVSNLKGRIASFFGDELIVGVFYHFFGLIFISYLISKKYSDYWILIIASAVIFLSFMIGERANFVRMFVSIFLILFLLLKINVFKKLISLFVIMIILIFTISVNDNLKNRYYGQLKSIYTLNGIEKYFKESQYGAHQDTAFQIFKNNKMFGVGMKNFREESKKEIYENTEYERNDRRQATHPHQIHLELLSETGLIGYLSFFVLILYSIYFSLKNYFKDKDPIQLSTIIFLFTSLFPLLPSGSIFSTYYGGIFWFNYALMLSFNSKFKS